VKSVIFALRDAIMSEAVDSTIEITIVSHYYCLLHDAERARPVSDS